MRTQHKSGRRESFSERSTAGNLTIGSTETMTPRCLWQTSQYSANVRTPKVSGRVGYSENDRIENAKSTSRRQLGMTPPLCESTQLNAAAKAGSLGSAIEKILADLKPEAAYFFAVTMGTGRGRLSSI